MKDVNIDDEFGMLDVCGSYVIYNLRGKWIVYFIDVNIGKEVRKIIIFYFKSKDGENVFIKEIKIIFLD